MSAQAMGRMREQGGETANMRTTGNAMRTREVAKDTRPKDVGPKDVGPKDLGPRHVGLAVVVLGALALGVSAAATTSAQAQEIQLTGPLAGAPGTRHQRLHRAGRFEIAPNISFTLLDEYQRTVMPGLKLTYHINDWFGVGLYGGYGIQYTTGLTDELQQKAIDDRGCYANPSQAACRLTAVSLTHRKGASLVDDQLAKFQWTVAPQVTFVPFRGKIALFNSLFVDTDLSVFVGGAIVGLQERKHCGDTGTDAQPGELSCGDPKSFALESVITGAPTFGLGLNFYPTQLFGFGAEWRGLPFSWNTSGFDVAGGGPGNNFPDNKVNGADEQFHFNSMITINLTFRLPPKVESSP